MGLENKVLAEEAAGTGQGEVFEFDGEVYTKASMLEANGHDAEFLSWADTARVGDWFHGCQRVR